MTTITKRLVGNLIGFAGSSLLFTASQSLMGYVYAKFMDLPAGSMVKALIIWNVAERSLMTMIPITTENKSNQNWMKVTVVIVSGTFGIHEMRKRGLLDNYATAFLIFCRATAVFVLMTKIAFPKAFENQKAPAQIPAPNI